MTDIVPATSTVMESLSVLSSATNSNYLSAAGWLSAQQLDTTRYLSERLQVMSLASMDQTLMLSYIDDLVHAWGGYSGYTIDPLDTALALQALKAANYGDTTLLGQSLNYLTTNQNSDGGWGLIPSTGSGQASGSESNAYVTAMVLRALSGYSSTFNVQGSIDKAKAYLLTKQNTDGGFGSSPSHVYETALSIISLIEAGSTNIQPLQNAVNYLSTLQLPDGSWNDDPYSTALALQALAKVQPNLAITTSDISFSKLMPLEGENVTITANVKNIGLEDASNVVVRFYLGDPSAGGVQIGADQIIPSLSIGSSSQVSITASFTGTGNRTIFV